MSQIKLLKIFLASPSDVSRERKYVLEVIKELDKSIAITNGITIQVVSSDSAFPGYGQDGQAVLNKQIGRMKEYDLFLGIMWSRIGTSTSRAVSGTAEEYERAVRAYNRYDKPQIWFYFRELKATLDTEEKLEQANGVIKFKKKVQRKALVREYKMPSNFRDRFRQDMLCWFSEYLGATPKLSVSSSSRSKKSSTAISNSNSPITKTASRRKSGSTSTAKKKTSGSYSSKTPTKSVTTSGAWMILGDNFFSTQSVKHQPDGSIIVRITPKNSTDEANLRALQPNQYNWSSQIISYAYQNEAGKILIQSVLPESIKGKTTFVLTLKPEQRSQGMGMDININGYSADQIAEFRARLLLLNETPPNQRENYHLLHFINGYNAAITVEKGIFPDLWAKMKRQPTDFLRQARLAAVYHLKMTNTVERILELKLGLIKNKTMSVRFRGQRKNFNPHRESSAIEVIGSCKL